MLLFNVTAHEAYRPFVAISPRFVAFRDATVGPCSFELTVLDCLKGLEYAMSVSETPNTRNKLFRQSVGARINGSVEAGLLRI